MGQGRDAATEAAAVEARASSACDAVREFPDSWLELRAREGVAPRALEFLILTAGRTGEVIGATWDEVDFDRALWPCRPRA